MIKELAAQLGVTEDSVINWEIRGIRPRCLEKVTARVTYNADSVVLSEFGDSSGAVILIYGPE